MNHISSNFFIASNIIFVKQNLLLEIMTLQNRELNHMKA